MCTSTGSAECGVYTYGGRDKVTQVMDFARKHQHPLQCVMEKVIEMEMRNAGAIGRVIERPDMPTFSRNLEQSLHRALALANERHHEYATLEHLLLALIDDQDAAAVMRACNVDLDKLRRSLTAYLEASWRNLVNDGNEDSTDRRVPAGDPARRHPCPVVRPRVTAPMCWWRSC